MLLGVPVVSSAVGGVSSMLMHGREGYLYPFDEAYMLAYYIEEIFRNRDKALEMSLKKRGCARQIRLTEIRISKLCLIYTAVCIERCMLE